MKFNSWASLPEIDRVLERVARWTLTDMWRPPANIIHKGGPPRASAGAAPRHLSSHFRLMTHVFRQTGDPLFLALPLKSLAAGFGERARPFGYRSAGLVFNYLPWFLAMLQEKGNPAPDPELELRGPEELTVQKGARARVCFDVRNAGSSAVEGLAVSFQARLDLPTTILSKAPESLAPGAAAELCFEIRPSGRINLTCEANRIAYGHLSMLYRRGGRSAVGHGWTRIAIGK
jgi:hypothetical protein